MRQFDSNDYWENRYKNKENNSESIANDMVTYFEKHHDHWLYVST